MSGTIPTMQSGENKQIQKTFTPTYNVAGSSQNKQKDSYQYIKSRTQRIADGLMSSTAGPAGIKTPVEIVGYEVEEAGISISDDRSS
jgi:hypothetical protein